MTVGLLTLKLQLPGCLTLKEKRHRLKGVIEKVRSRFNVSASEVDYHDLHQSALIGVAMVSTERAFIEQVFARVEEFFASGDGLVIVDSGIEWF
jgi:uncharacterized protein YlxP (DUF503 family)